MITAIGIEAGRPQRLAQYGGDFDHLAGMAGALEGGAPATPERWI